MARKLTPRRLNFAPLPSNSKLYSMPLPKSCTVAARATDAYAEAWSVVLHECWAVKPPRDEPLPPLVQLLPFIRQLLTCCACAGLLEDAMISSSCGHCYCAKCQMGTPLLKIQCRQCKERTALVAENQIRLVVACYRRMCHVLADYLTTTPLASFKSGEFTLAKGREIPEGFNPIAEIVAEVVDGIKVSRTVLLVLPPSKYLNPKPPPDPPTPKKDQTSPSHHVDRTSTVKTNNDINLHHGESPCDDVMTTSLCLSLPVSSVSRSHHRKRPRPDRKRGGASDARPPARASLIKQRREEVPSVWIHSDVDFISARPVAHRGEMRLFASLKLLKLKQATLCGPETEPVLQVQEECLDKQFVTSNSFVYKIRQDLPLSSLLPQSFRPKISSISASPLTLKPDTPNKTTPIGSKTISPVLHLRSTLTPRARFKLLRPKYKSPYLHDSHDSTTQQKRTPKQAAPETKKTPTISVTPCSSGNNAPRETPPMKKKKRGPTTPGHWRCRCGTNNPQTFDRICARGKCPCYVKNIPCINCLCRHCKNPFNKSPEL